MGQSTLSGLVHKGVVQFWGPKHKKDPNIERTTHMMGASLN